MTDLAEHGVRPGARELAGQIDHTKAWTERRRALLERLLGQPFQELVAQYDRLVELRGPLSHGEGDLWAFFVRRLSAQRDDERADVRQSFGPAVTHWSWPSRISFIEPEEANESVRALGRSPTPLSVTGVVYVPKQQA